MQNNVILIKKGKALNYPDPGESEEKHTFSLHQK